MVSHNPADLEHGYCPNCHDFTGIREGALRFRLFVEQRMVAENWVDLDGDFVTRARQVGDEQNELARAAYDAGLPWHVEVYDPALPDAYAHIRFGTDDGAMIFPIPIEPRQKGDGA